MIYLATAYSHKDPAIMAERFDRACLATSHFLRLGINVFSPIVHSVPLVRFGLGTTYSYWREFDVEMLQKCDQLWILMSDGWQDSIGVCEEIAEAKRMGKPIKYISESEAGI